MNRLLLDVVKLSELKPLIIFCVALEYSCNQEDELFDEQVALWSYEHYIETQKLPLYVENFCLDVMVKNIILIGKDGKHMRKVKHA